MRQIDFSQRISGRVRWTFYSVDISVRPPQQKRVLVLDRYDLSQLAIHVVGSEAVSKIILSRKPADKYITIIALDDSGQFNAEVVDYAQAIETEVISNIEY